MNVLIVSESLWPYGGGGELATYLYARLLIGEGVRVKILLRNRNKSREWQGLDVYSIKSIGSGKFSITLGESTRLIKQLVQWADVVYFTTGLFNLIPLVQRLGKPFAVHIHSYFPLCPIGHMHNFVYNKECTPSERICYRCIWVYESMKKKRNEALASAMLNSVFGLSFLRLAMRANAIIFVSKYQQKLFTEYAKSLDIKTPMNFVVYNPIPTTEYEQPENDDICFLGGLDPIKGFFVLFRAWLILYKRFRNVKLRAAMTSGLPSLIEKIGINRYPRLGPNELKSVCWRARVVTVPSLSPEPSPYVTVEALLRGKLLIASNVGGIPELVDNAPGVKLVPPGDVEALAEALEWALSLNNRVVIELGLKNREYALNKFNNKRAVRELIRIFENILN
jgi:glycosyltransferase involved in cell wall biosynthesis